MIETIYPEHIQAQLDILDKKIAKMYEKELPKEKDGKFLNYAERERIKRNLYERTKPLLDEKVRLIQNSCPKYIIHKES